MSLHKSLRIFAAGLCIVGLAIITPLAYFWYQNHQAVAYGAGTVVQPTVLKPTVNLVTGRPARITIPSLSIDLQVIDGVFNAKSGEWTLTLDKAQFATPSVQPNNQTGNTLIYGHYRPEVFAYLHHIQPGAEATVTTDNGIVFHYTFQTTEALNPADTSVFTYKGAPRLTVQTCSGAFMQNRQMYYFAYNGYDKP